MNRLRLAAVFATAVVAITMILRGYFLRSDPGAVGNAAFFQIRNVQARVEWEIEEALRSRRAISISEIEAQMLRKYGTDYLNSEIPPKQKLWINPNFEMWTNLTNGGGIALISPVKIQEKGFVAITFSGHRTNVLKYPLR